MRDPQSFTYLGVALALGLLSLVGMGGVGVWSWWEHNNNDGPQYGASGTCQSSPTSGSPISVGTDLVLSQAVDSDQVTISGVLYGTALDGSPPVQLALTSATSCSPFPTDITQSTTVTPPTDATYAPVDWTVSPARLEARGDDITGRALVVLSQRGVPQACCIIDSLPGYVSSREGHPRRLVPKGPIPPPV